MSMRKMIVMWMLTLSTAAWAAEPVKAQSGKPVAAKHKPVAPKYYYVRATPMVAAPVAAAAVVSVANPVQTAEPEVGEVHTGRMVCELGNSVTVTPDPQQAETFIVQMKKNTYRMSPVATTTGAVRLEDAQAGAMWLQLPHKSMLMNSKLGQRMADECQSEHQTAVAHRMKLDPPPSLLDAPALAKK